MKRDFGTGKELIEICHSSNKKICEVMIEREIYVSGKTRNEIIESMRDNLSVMRNAVEKGLNEDVKSVSGLIGGDAKRLKNRYNQVETAAGTRINKAVASAMAVIEVNSSMGLIVAAPTAGSSGILPGVIITVGEEFQLTDDDMIMALFTAGAVGYIITKNATVSGAEGGCQAETGTASAMAAAGVVEMLGGTSEQALQAASITIKNILGMVCDPVAGLVEVPCLKRNAIGTANALISADMALAGIKSIIPFDEVVEAMYKVGEALPCSLRETAQGGLAATPTGIRIQKEIFSK